jgi:hypothetical protein
MGAAEGGESEGGVRREVAGSVSDTERQMGVQERCSLAKEESRGSNNPWEEEIS